VPQWGPDQKQLQDGNTMGIWKRKRLLLGDEVWWADCTDGWRSDDYIEYNDAEREFGEHLGKQHGGK
jgi:hypothetical protein